jgi:Arc-like DNA binding domain
MRQKYSIDTTSAIPYHYLCITNKDNQMVGRKRAPGAGRKPKGEFENLTSPFSLRMPPDLRKQVEAAARRTGRSMSQEILRRVQNSFHRDRDRSNDPALRAICFLISQIAKHASVLEQRTWRTDPFKFKTFKRGVAVLLSKLEPSGEMVCPFKKAGNSVFSSYEQFGDFIAEAVWGDLHRASVTEAAEFADQIVEDIQSEIPESEGEAELLRKLMPELRQRMRDRYEGIAYGMTDAKRHLKLESKGAPK